MFLPPQHKIKCLLKKKKTNNHKPALSVLYQVRKKSLIINKE